MSNLFWYIFLAVVGLVISIYTIFIKKGTYKVSTLIVFYLFTAGAAWVGEFIVLGLFNSYAYKTDLFTDPWAQNLFGHLIINTTIYPAVAVVMVAYSLGYSWIFIVTLLFTLIEYLFVKHGIYEHHWWKYYMTLITVATFMSISRYWFSKMLRKPYGPTRAFTYYLVAMVIIHIPAPVLLLMGKLHYQLSWIDNFAGNFYLSSTIIVFLYHIIESFVLIICVCILKKGFWNILPFIVSIVSQGLFAKFNILIMDNGWKLIYTLLIYQILIALFILLEKQSLKHDQIINNNEQLIDNL